MVRTGDLLRPVVSRTAKPRRYPRGIGHPGHRRTSTDGTAGREHRQRSWDGVDRAGSRDACTSGSPGAIPAKMRPSRNASSAGSGRVQSSPAVAVRNRYRLTDAGVSTSDPFRTGADAATGD